mgnify:CR=1 FL=1
MSDPHIPPFATHTAGRTLRYARIFGFSTLALLLVGGGLRLAFHYGEARALESRTAASLQRTVSTVTVRAGDATRSVTLPASLRGRSETTVYARSAGYLAAWHKTIGERVKKGELLATIDAPEQDQELAQARATMQKGERLSGDLAELQHLWAGSDSALATLRSAARRLDRIAGEHPLLAEALAALDRAVIEASEAEDKLERAGEALSHDPAALDRIETRLFELRAMARKHHCQVDDLPQTMREMRSALDLIEGGEAGLAELEAAAKAAGEAYRTRAAALSALRTEAAVRLDTAVAGELAPLKLDAAKFRTSVTRLPDERWGPAGIDAVEFLISTNPGAPFAPLAKIASGGELSRFILALKVALAEQGGAATVIFDEIDRGVGGAVASAIGERLSRLAQGGQLLAVTHSPQVAARGQQHYVIAKSSEGTVTRTSVHLLDAAGRQEEIARMLSGAEVTAEARAQADRLLEGV